MKFFKLKLNGINHQFYTWGEPSLPKLFFFHSWMDTGASFQFAAEYLKDKFYCIAPDLRGFGKSEHTSNPLGYFFYEFIADAHVMFEKLAPNEKVKVVGHSMGGNILYAYAGTYPEKVSHFTNIEGFGVRDMPLNLAPDVMRQWLERTLKPPAIADYKRIEDVVERLKENHPRIPKNVLNAIVPCMTEKTTQGYRLSSDQRHKWNQPFLFRLEGVIPFWKKIQAKCLFVMGEKSERMPEWLSEIDPEKDITERLSHFPKDSKKITIPDCGHMIHWEKPKELAQLIRDFNK